jgi:CcmD family protein
MEYQTQTETFVKASDLPSEAIPAAPLVFFAYAFVWVVLIGYVFSLWRKLSRVEREVATVAAQIERQR